MKITVIPALFGSLIASFCTTPLDTLKTRLQSGIEYKAVSGIKNQIQHIYNIEGAAGLYYGVQHRLSRSVISTILYLSLYEYFL